MNQSLSKNELSKLLLRIYIIGINHCVGNISMSQSDLNKANVFCFLIEFDGKRVSQRVKFFWNRAIQLPDLMKAMIADRKNLRAKLFVGKRPKGVKKAGLQRDLSIV